MSAPGKVVCPNCGQETVPVQFCEHCGFALTKTAQKIASDRVRSESEINWFLFCLLCICTSPCGAIIYLWIASGD